MYDFLWHVVGWAVLWYSSYRVVKSFNGSKCPEYSCRIITEIHAVIITILTCQNVFFSGTWPFYVLGLPNTPIQKQLMCVSLGYFLYDFLWCLYYMTEGPVMLIHHFISIVTISFSLWMEVSGTEVLGTIFGSEISSIFLNLRWFIKYHHCHDTTFGMATDIVFVLTFIGVRIFLGGYLAYCEVLLSPAPVLMKIGGAAMYTVNCVFLLHILSFARYKIKKHSRKSAKSLHSNANGIKNHSKPIHENGFTHAAGDVRNGLHESHKEKSL